MLTDWCANPNTASGHRSISHADMNYVQTLIVTKFVSHTAGPGAGHWHSKPPNLQPT